MRTIKFYTLGCKANQYDTQNIREQFARAGFREIGNGRKADICLINTCTVTHRADADSLQFIRRAKRENTKARIIVTGCLTELDSDKIKQTDRSALIVRNRDKENMLNYLGLRAMSYELRAKKGISGFCNHTRAFLKIQDGCDNFCSYCKVPLVRGRSKSKPVDEVIREARQLVENGFKEIVLTGICLGAHNDLIKVISSLEKIELLERIRLSSIEAGDVTDELIKRIARSKKVCPHLHIPIQSGDNQILKKMGRKYSRLDYLKLIRKLKKNVPQVAITTDVLVGFPGESEKNFFNTVDLIKKIAPLRVHIFPYSKREGTAAAGLKGELQPRIVKKRIANLKKAADDCSAAYKNKFLDKTLLVLFESRAKENPLFWEGHSANYIPIRLKSKRNLNNCLIPVKLEKKHILASS